MDTGPHAIWSLIVETEDWARFRSEVLFYDLIFHLLAGDPLLGDKKVLIPLL